MRNAILIIGILLILAAVTSPKKPEHYAKLKETVMRIASEKGALKLEGSNDFETTGSAIGMTIGLTLVDKVLEPLLTVDNYLVFSLGTLHLEGKSKAITIGVFGNVFLMPGLEEKLKEATPGL